MFWPTQYLEDSHHLGEENCSKTLIPFFRADHEIRAVWGNQGLFWHVYAECTHDIQYSPTHCWLLFIF